MNSSHKILVLNRLWQAVNVIGIQRAFGLLLQNNAQVINTGDDSFQVMDSTAWFDYSAQQAPGEDEACVQTVHLRIRIPKVLLLRKYDRLPMQEIRFTRDNLFERDQYRCQYCGHNFSEDQLNMDHVIPKTRGGRTSWENIVTACIPCNTRKANRLPHQANMHLIKKPSRPRLRPFVSSLIDREYDSDWDHFLNLKKK